MLLNILYYDQAAEATTTNTNQTGLSFGPLYITPEQVCTFLFISMNYEIFRLVLV
jgi:hypothetical protein